MSDPVQPSKEFMQALFEKHAGEIRLSSEGFNKLHERIKFLESTVERLKKEVETWKLNCKAPTPFEVKLERENEHLLARIKTLKKKLGYKSAMIKRLKAENYAEGAI